MRKYNIIKLTSTLCITLGIFIISYPFLKNIYENYEQKQLIEKWQESLKLIGDENNDNIDRNDWLMNTVLHQKFMDYSDELLKKKEMEYKVEKNSKKLNREDNNDTTVKKEEQQVKIMDNMIGTLTIDNIELYLPILKGTTTKNLSMALTTIEPTTKPGQIGNIAIAGHRNLQYGKNFNRLNEIEVGDSIILNDGKNSYTYTVVEKFLVKPEETWILNGNDRDRMITLITCHPMGSPTHRLVIKGKILE